MTEQEVFNRVAVHLLSQKKRSEDKFGCLYRSPEGLKCAIGCLIPDEKYSPSMERNLVDRLDLSLIGLSDIDLWFLESLQSIHDQYDPTHWLNELSYFAQDWGISEEILEQFREIPC